MPTETAATATAEENILLKTCINCLCCCGLCRVFFYPVQQQQQQRRNRNLYNQAAQEIQGHHHHHPRLNFPADERQRLLTTNTKGHYSDSADNMTENEKQIRELGFDQESITKTVNKKLKDFEIPDTSEPKLIEEEEVCPTCLEPYTYEDPKIITECGHHFHLPCIYEWLERSKLCPVCFKPMVFVEPDQDPVPDPTTITKENTINPNDE